tara:strand:+ start:163 stop:852 length:690 start_codon:yes stop_codon:yes gene_type:complete
MLINFAYNLLISQKNIDTQNLLWIRYNLKVKLNDTYQIKQEIENRIFWSPWRQHQLITRTLLSRKLDKGWDAGIGLAYSSQATPQDPEIRDFKNVIELRPQLEVTYQQQLSNKININHRFWSEFRFFEQPEGSFDYKNNRTRYKLEFNYTISSKTSLRAFDEILLNIGDHVFDQNRYGTSFQYMPYENFGLEIGYINWYQERASGVDFYNRHIIRLTIHQTINLKKSKS